MTGVNGMPIINQKRGRGRPPGSKNQTWFGGGPKENKFYGTGPGCGGRLDPTNDHFLRTEEREGGPIDPFSSLHDNISLIFGGIPLSVLRLSYIHVYIYIYICYVLYQL